MSAAQPKARDTRYYAPQPYLIRNFIKDLCGAGSAGLIIWMVSVWGPYVIHYHQ
jgi:hypothetical protein